MEGFQEIIAYCLSFQKIQDYTLAYLNETNDANDQTNLINLFSELKNQQIIENEDQFDQFLRMLASIGSFHRSSSNFFSKLNKILNEYKNIIKNNYSNEEIFSIFLHNETILHFLLKENIFQFDSDIKNLLDNDDHKEQRNYFFPTEEINEKYQEEGQNHTQLCKIIRSDDIQSFISYIEQNNVQLRSNISPSVYETNVFLRKRQSTTTLIQYSAFYGSLHIFKYIIEKQPELLDQTVWEFAFYGENKEIIKLIETNKIIPPNDNFESCLLNSIISHQNSTFELIKKKFQVQKQDDDNNDDDDDDIPPYKIDPFLRYSIISFNFKMIANLLLIPKNTYENNVNYVFTKACKAGFHKIVETFLLSPHTKINNCGTHSPLQHACIVGDLYLVKMLLTVPDLDINLQSVSYVHDIQTQDYDGLTALELAIRYGHNKIVSLLLSRSNIDVNKKSRWRGNAPLSIAAKFNNVRATKLLLAWKNIDVNILNHDEYRINKNLMLTGGREAPLHIACIFNRVEIVKLLLKHPNIDVNIQNWEGKKPVELTDNQEIKNLFNDL